MNSLCLLPVFGLNSRTEHLVCHPVRQQFAGASRQSGRKKKLNPVLRASIAPAFHWAGPFHLFSGVTKGDFFTSVANVLIVSFRTRTKNCLCGKGRPDSCLVVAASLASTNYCFPQGKVCRRSSILHLWMCILSEPSLRWGRSEEGISR